MLFPKSLRGRFFASLVIASAAAAIIVAAASWSLGRRWATAQMHQRFASIESALEHTSFPLTPAVLETLSKLSGTHWVTLAERGRLLASTLPEAARLPETLPETLGGSAFDRLKEISSAANDGDRDVPTVPQPITIGNRTYYPFAVPRPERQSRGVDASRVVVLFDKDQIDASARRAAVLPLATGLSTVALIGAIVVVAGSRLIGRLRRLERQVDRIAAGDFDSSLQDIRDDEVGRLAAAIHTMGGQLKQLWRTVNQQQGAKLLHQISGGMAHSLRNTMTGARMALELYGEGDAKPEEIRVALRQIEIAEDYVARLLTLTSVDRRSSRPQRLRACLEDVESTHRPIARHLRVGWDWQLEPGLETRRVAEGTAFSAALSNLVHNALQAGDRVWVTARMIDHSTCAVGVADNGPGIDAAIAETLFDPFVTSKPEGMGLGLAVAKRVVEQLGGRIRWSREGDRTVFEMTVQTVDGEDDDPAVPAETHPAADSLDST